MLKRIEDRQDIIRAEIARLERELEHLRSLYGLLRGTGEEVKLRWDAISLAFEFANREREWTGQDKAVTK